MADVVTRLEVQGAEQWISALNKAATAQDALLAAVSRKVPRITIGEGLVQATLAIENAKAASVKLVDENKNLGATFEAVVSKVSGSTKALLENAAAAEKAAQHQKALAEAAKTVGANSRTAPLIGDLTRNQQINARETELFRQAIPGRGNLNNVGQAAALAANKRFVEQQVQQQELADQKLIRGAQLREQKRTQIERQAFDERVKIAATATQRQLDQQKVAAGTDFFSRRTGVVSQQTTGFDNKATSGLTAISAATDKVTQSSLKKNQALDEQGKAEKRSGSSGITYLSTLSAIHAASFLLGGQTFTTAGSLITLGAAFSKMGLGASLIGVTLGGILGTIGALTTAFDRLVQGVQTAAQATVAAGLIIATSLAAGTAASIKLASGVETAFAEVVAFGEPGKLTGNAAADLERLDNVVSGLGRTFGISAQDVTQASSQYIKSGNDIEAAINGGAEAVIKLQVASRGELIPTQAARAVSVLSNAFKELQGDAGRAADIIIATGQKSALTMSEVSQAFQQAGPSAAQYNISATDLAATLAVLANNGLRGQVAGTGFKQVMLDLVNPSEKAAQALNDAGVSVKDLDGNIRPLGDIINDLNKAFGEEARALDSTGNAAKAQGLAMIFGSRANLAASIIARTGAKDFNEMRDAIENVSSTDIVNALLAPTAAQAQIASVNVQELARSFGGPLNVALGSAISQVNQFLQAIDRKHFETASQAILAVATGQGFGPIIDSLDELSKEQPEVAQFLTDLLNNFLAVRNAIVGTFIPAMSEAGRILQEAFQTVDVGQNLNAITVAIIGVVNAGSRLVVFVAQLISDFVTGNERGTELRNTLAGLATGIGTTLVGAFIAAAVPMIAVIALLQKVGEQAINTLNLVNKIAGVANAPEQIKDSIKQYGSLDNAVLAIVRDTVRAEANVRLLNQTVQAMQAENRQVPISLIGERDQAERELKGLNARLENIQEFKREAERLAAEPFKTGISDLLEGDLPTFLTNLARQAQAAMDTINRGGGVEHEPTLPGFDTSPGKVDQIARAIRDIERDAAREIANLQEDVAVKRIEREDSTNQRLLEIATQFVTRRKQILDEAEERKAELDLNLIEQRQDRTVLEQAQKFIRSLDQEHEAANQRRDLREQQALSKDERRQRERVQNSEKALSILEQGEERFFNTQQQLLERSFARNQQAQDRQLSERQRGEEESLTRQLRNESTLRDEQKRLAEAKTPQEREDVQRQITASRADTAFSDQQQSKLTALRKRHEAERVKFSQQQEDNAFNYRLSLQVAEFNFKLRLEAEFQAQRRQLEEGEFNRTDARDSAQLEQRIARSLFEANRREQIEKSLQGVQDELQNQQTRRQQARIDQTAQRQVGQAGQTAVQQTFETLAAAELARQRALNAQDKQLRAIGQRAQERGETLTEQQGERPSGLETALNRVNIALLQTGLLIQADKALADEFFNSVQMEQFRQIQQVAPTVDLNRPLEGFAGLQAPSAQVAGTAAPISLLLPPNFAQQVAAGVATGIRQIPQGTGPQINIGGNVYDPTDILRLYNQYIFNTARARR